MYAFWGLTGLTAAGAVLLILTLARRAELARGAAVADDGPERELDELDRLRARGLLDDAGFELARAEVARRALAAEPERVPGPTGASIRRLVPVGAAAAVLAAGALYFVLGRPGMADQPMRARVAQWAAMPETLDAPRLAAVMGEAVGRNPDDPQALALLGAARFEAGDPVGAASAFRRLLALRPDDAQGWARLGESLVRAAEGRVDGDAEAAFREAVRLDSDQLGARYFLGEAALERGDAAAVREMWGPIVEALPPSDPRRADLVARMPGGNS